MYELLRELEAKLTSVQEGISDARERRSEIEDAIAQLEDAESNIESAIDAIQMLDELPSISVDGFEFDA